MTREQIDAIEQLYIESDSLDARSYSIRELIAAARRAVELEEALEYAASENVMVYRQGDGRYCAVYYHQASETVLYGATPLEAIQAARRAPDAK